MRQTTLPLHQTATKHVCISDILIVPHVVVSRTTPNLDFAAHLFPEDTEGADQSMLSDEDGSPSSQQETDLQLASQPRPVRMHVPVSDGLVGDKQLLDAILASSGASRAEDEFESFGRSVAATLRRLKPRLQAAAKVKIQQLLYDLEFGETSDGDTASLDLHCS